MRYLDREPRRSDRVMVEYEAFYDHVIPSGRHVVQIVDGTGACAPVVPDTATIRVIAPEPAVGDVVTEDMDLPEGSIIEGKCGDLAFRASDLHDQPCWNHGGDHESLGWLMKTDNWRIVRIGPAQ